MASKIAVGIDIGTYQVKVLVAESSGDAHDMRVIGTGLSHSKGLHHGYILNSHDVTEALNEAIAQAQKSSGVKIKKVYASIGGVGLSSLTSTAETVIARPDAEITAHDVDNVLNASEAAIPPSTLLNQKILHAIPLEYKIDGQEVLGDPLGMKGSKLEIKTLFVTCLDKHLTDLVDAIEDADLEVIDIMAAPIAASFVTLTRAQKMAGVVLANIGAETISLAVFENNIPISLETFPMGSTDITNDIALGLKVPLDEAEQIKIGAITSTSYPQKKLEEIVQAKLNAMFDLIDAHLKKIEKHELLPAGIVITGGGSGIGSIEDLAREALKLPSRIASLTDNAEEKTRVKDAFWSVAYGLCLVGMTGDDSTALGVKSTAPKQKSIWKWIKQFLP